MAESGVKPKRSSTTATALSAPPPFIDFVPDLSQSSADLQSTIKALYELATQSSDTNERIRSSTVSILSAHCERTKQIRQQEQFLLGHWMLYRPEALKLYKSPPKLRGDESESELNEKCFDRMLIGQLTLTEIFGTYCTGTLVFGVDNHIINSRSAIATSSKLDADGNLHICLSTRSVGEQQSVRNPIVLHSKQQLSVPSTDGTLELLVNRKNPSLLKGEFTVVFESDGGEADSEDCGFRFLGVKKENEGATGE